MKNFDNVCLKCSHMYDGTLKDCFKCVDDWNKKKGFENADNIFVLTLEKKEDDKRSDSIKKDDVVNHPSHYKSESGLEVIDVIKAFTSELSGVEAVDTANVIKYICRWKKKNGVEDLKKAKWYINHLINYLEKGE